MIRRFALASAILIAVGSAAPSTAVAGSANANLNITASVPNNCTISAAPVSFGAYDPIVTNASSPLDGTGTLGIDCTDGADYLVTLGQGDNAGSGSSNAIPARNLSLNGKKLSYNLYQNPARNTVWANTNETGVSSKATGGPAVMNVFGRILPGQNVPAGSYSDTVTATVTY